MNFDVSAFSGHWPYRFLRRGNVSQQQSEYRQMGFAGGCMSSLDAIFYNDPWEADEPLLKLLDGTGWKPAMCVNPTLPWAELSMRHAHSLGVRYIRLYPGVHHYPVCSAEAVCRLAAELNMTVIITGRLEDERLCYLLDQDAVCPKDCCFLAERFPRLPFLLSGFYLSELLGIHAAHNLWIDTAGLRHGTDPIDTLIRNGFPLERILFGSMSPLQCLHSHLMNLPENRKKQILSINPKNFFGGNQ